jgi:hypothetical protein
MKVAEKTILVYVQAHFSAIKAFCRQAGRADDFAMRALCSGCCRLPCDTHACLIMLEHVFYIMEPPLGWKMSKIPGIC